MLQHTWTYKPLVHDVLGLALNRVTVEEPASAPAAAAVGLAPQAPAKKHFEARAPARSGPAWSPSAGRPARQRAQPSAAVETGSGDSRHWRQAVAPGARVSRDGSVLLSTGAGLLCLAQPL